MPKLSRRSHRKSRLGCRRCKTRRIKCDEVHPVCGGCERASLSCDFSAMVFSRPRPDNTLIPSPTTPRLHCSSDGSIRTPGGQLQATLFHHYLDMVKLHCSKDQRIWSGWLLDLALIEPSLMDAILGVTAFNLRRLAPYDKQISNVSHVYMARAIKSHTEQVNRGFTTENVAALLATGTFIMFHASANQAFLGQSRSGYRLPLHWFYPFKNANKLLQAALPCFQGTPVAHLYMPVGKPLGPLPREEEPGLETFDFLLGDLSRDRTGADAVKAYEFITMLEAGDPRTLAIVGYFFMLLRKASHLWWAQGAAEKEFAAVMSLLPRDWRPMMAWEVEELAWDENSCA
ncbi:hypothetical protein LCI18_014480 [Fusarium solani-melongenae]|uniref:Uncharacterized protein n=1 Tax=Fusarium solani subsp. cucurbitae TaxID=2747967 RepID=A0ACD3ZQP7_FUSSC|nr:hypothetical protein LCI18_014480 [Fusarium solani-melongenae]